MPNYTVACDKCAKTQVIFRHVADHGAWPWCCRKKTRQILCSSHQIIKDIDPYRAVATDVATGKRPLIGGRASHREYLRRNGYVEVGNDKIRPRGQYYQMESPKAEIVKNFKKVTGAL